MRRTLLHALTLAAALAAPLAALAQEPASLVPADRTLAFVEVADCKEAEAALRATDMGQVWQQLEPFFDQIRAGLEPQLAEQKAQFEQDSGVRPDDLLALLRGGFAVAIIDTAPAGGELQPVPVAILPAAAKPRVAAIVEAMKKKEGPPLYLIDRPGAVCVTVDQNALNAATPGAAPMQLALDPQFLAARAKALGAGTKVAFFYSNVGAIMARTIARDERAMGDLEKLGATAIRAAAIGFSCEGGRIKESFAIAAPGERKGVLKLLDAALRPLDAAKLAAETPGDCLSVAAIGLDPKALLDEGLALAAAMDPSARRDFDRFQKDFEKEFGFRLKEDLLATLGDSLVSELLPPGDGLLPRSIISLGVRDAARLEASLETLARRGGFEVKAIEGEGHTTHYLQVPLGHFGDNPTRHMSQDDMTAQAVLVSIASAWTIDRGRIYLAGAPQDLDERFERLAKGALARAEAFRAEVARVPAGARSFTWTRLGAEAGVLYDVAFRVAHALEPMLRRAGIPADTSLLPRSSAIARVVRSSVGALAIDADGLTLTAEGGVPVLTVMPIIAAIAIPNLIQARQGANEAAAIGALRTLTTAQSLFREGDKDQNGILDYAASLEMLGNTRLIDPVLASGVKMGYRFEIVPGENIQFQWGARAMPVVPGKAGGRSFWVDESGVIRCEIAPMQAGRESPPLGMGPSRKSPARQRASRMGGSKRSNEAAAIGALRTVCTAQSLFREGDKDMNGILDYAKSLDALQKTNLIDEALGSGEKMGYRFTVVKADEYTYSVTAVPIEPEKTGDRTFFMDESGVIRFAVAPEEAGPKSTPVGG